MRGPLFLYFYLTVLESNRGCAIKVPGPCKYCASISAPCTISVRRKQRPFYLVSEEEYRYGIEILQKFFPDTDLNLNTLRGLAQKVDRLPASPGPSTQATGPSVVQPPSECADDESAQAFDSYHDSVQTNLQYANVEEIQPPSNKRDIPPDDNSGPPAQPTTKDKGFMVMDPTGTTSKRDSPLHIKSLVSRETCSVCLIVWQDTSVHVQTFFLSRRSGRVRRENHSDRKRNHYIYLQACPLLQTSDAH